MAHGDVNGAIAALRDFASRPTAELEAIGAANRRRVAEAFDAETMRAEFCEFVESMARE